MIISSSAMASITYGSAKDVPVIKKDFRASGNHGRILMIQAGRNGIIFHSCHAAFPFLHLSLSFGCAISFCKNSHSWKAPSAFPKSRVLSFFPFVPFSFCRTGTWQYPDIPFRLLSPLRWYSLLRYRNLLSVQCSVCSHLNSVRPNYTKIPADSADLQPKRAPLCRWTDCTFTSPATTVFRSFSE